jgi:cold shock protein
MTKDPVVFRPSNLAGGTDGATRAMAISTVRWFNSAKGIRFIQAEDASKQMLVRFSFRQVAGMLGLNESQDITCQLIMERGKAAAANLGAA